MKNVKDLWLEFGDVPMDPETECIEEPWNIFPAGTFREDIWHWFEETFHVSVATDLMGQGSGIPERISKEMVQKGIENKTIWFSTYDQCMTAHIGDYWFYVSADYGKTEEDYTREELVQMVHKSINDEPVNSADEEEAAECLYYEALLEESGIQC